MPTGSDIRKTLADASPLYAVAGAGDFAVEKLREVPARLSSLRVEPKAVQDRISETLNTIQDEARTLPEKAQSVALTGIGKATETYEEFTARGRNVVGRVRRQPSTQRARTHADTTVAKAKATKTTAERSAASTKSAAKATATSATKTAKASGQAAKDAADKIG